MTRSSGTQTARSDCDFHGTYAAFDDSGIDYVLDLPDTREAAADTYDDGADEEGLAAATHVYRTKGDYIVSTSTVWRGLYTFAGITYYYDPVVVSTSRPYEVIEIRSIIGQPVTDHYAARRVVKCAQDRLSKSRPPSPPSCSVGPVRSRVVPNRYGAHMTHAERMQQRYSSAMATIQIRNVPDNVHRRYQSRAALAGQSLQEYLLAELIESVKYATPAELISEVEREMGLDPDGFATGSSADIIRDDRESH